MLSLWDANVGCLLNLTLSSDSILGVWLAFFALCPLSQTTGGGASRRWGLCWLEIRAAHHRRQVRLDGALPSMLAPHWNHLLVGPFPSPRFTSDVLSSSPQLQSQADHGLVAISDSETCGFQWFLVISLSLMVLLVPNSVFGFALSVVLEMESRVLCVQTSVSSPSDAQALVHS